MTKRRHRQHRIANWPAGARRLRDIVKDSGEPLRYKVKAVGLNHAGRRRVEAQSRHQGDTPHGLAKKRRQPALSRAEKNLRRAEKRRGRREQNRRRKQSWR